MELHAGRLRWAQEEAEKAGVKELIRFVQGDIYEVPIADASVVTLYLLRPANLRLRPRLWKELRPGTRVVSSTFDMGDWEPERTVVVDLEDAAPALSVPGTKVTRTDGPRQWLTFRRTETTAAQVVASVAATARLRDLTIEEPAIEDIVRGIYERTSA